VSVNESRETGVKNALRGWREVKAGRRWVCWWGGRGGEELSELFKRCARSAATIVVINGNETDRNRGGVAAAPGAEVPSRASSARRNRTIV